MRCRDRHRVSGRRLSPHVQGSPLCSAKQRPPKALPGKDRDVRSRRLRPWRCPSQGFCAEAARPEPRGHDVSQRSQAGPTGGRGEELTLLGRPAPLPGAPIPEAVGFRPGKQVTPQEARVYLTKFPWGPRRPLARTPQSGCRARRTLSLRVNDTGTIKENSRGAQGAGSLSFGACVPLGQDSPRPP